MIIFIVLLSGRVSLCHVQWIEQRNNQSTREWKIFPAKSSPIATRPFLDEDTQLHPSTGRCLPRTRHFYYHESLGFDCSGDLSLVLLMQTVLYALCDGETDNQYKVEQTLSTPTVGWLVRCCPWKNKIALANDNKSPPAEIMSSCVHLNNAWTRDGLPRHMQLFFEFQFKIIISIDRRASGKKYLAKQNNSKIDREKRNYWQKITN